MLTTMLMSLVRELDVRTIVYEQLYEPCVQSMVAATYVVPLVGWVLGVCIAAAFVVVALLVVVVWRLKAKPKPTDNSQRMPLAAT